MADKSLAAHLGIDPESPDYLAALEKARADFAAAEIRYCKNGCVNYYRPGETEPFTGIGEAGCDQPECS